MKNNPRISKKERGLIKGALRRVFSRSDLRRIVIESSIVRHEDPSRPRVKTWCQCALCHGFEAKSSMQADHIKPVVPIDSSLEEMTADELVANIWCEIHNLQAVCIACHKNKSREEMKERRKYKKSKKA